MSIGPKSSLVDIAFAVCTALDKVDVTAVLTGGSAATFYAKGAYQSADLDFVITFQGQADGANALSQLGFEQTADYYLHPESHFPLEFPPGPLMVGDDLIESWHTERRPGEVLHVLSPTDSCRDRLAALLIWNDRSGLEQALAVALAQREQVDLGAIRKWCQRENAEEKFRLFEQRLATLPEAARDEK